MIFFERRFCVYDAAKSLLASIVPSGEVKDEDLFDLTNDYGGYDEHRVGEENNVSQQES